TETQHNAVVEVRLFACSFIASLQRGIDRSRKRFAKLDRAAPHSEAHTHGLMMAAPAPEPGETPPSAAAAFERMVRLLTRAETLVTEYRKLLDQVAALPPERSVPEVATELRLIDEYCGYRLRDLLASLLTISS